VKGEKVNMKRIIKLTVILSLLVQIGHAQTITTEAEYKVFYDSIVSKLQLAEQDTSKCIGKPLSKFIKNLDKCGLKIIQADMWGKYNRQLLFPQYIYGMNLKFTTNEINDFVQIHNLKAPFVVIDFTGSKPYEKALSLFKKYKGDFTEEVETFYFDAVIKSIGFYCMDGIHWE